jgi:hypothetical protein
MRSFMRWRVAALWKVLRRLRFKDDDSGTADSR